MGEQLTGEDFNSLFRYFTSSAFRLETRPFYTVEEERESINEFLAGQPRPYTEFPFYAAWYDQIRTLTSQGKRVQRVRIMDEPPTDYPALGSMDEYVFQHRWRSNSLYRSKPGNLYRIAH